MSGGFVCAAQICLGKPKFHDEILVQLEVAKHGNFSWLTFQGSAECVEGICFKVKGILEDPTSLKATFLVNEKEKTSHELF